MSSNNFSPFRRAKGVLLTFALSVALSIFPTVASSEGTEPDTIGPPSIPIAIGTGAVFGTGLVAQPGTIEVVVPDEATVLQVLLYWEGQMNGNKIGDDELIVEGAPVTGDLIGGPTLFFSNPFGGAYSSAFRADITDRVNFAPGTNTVEVDEADFTRANNGAGILVIYDDGSVVDFELRDGLDLSRGLGPTDLPAFAAVAQTFSFASASVDRTATLAMFFSSVSGSASRFGFRPSSIEITVGNNPTQIFSNLFDSFDGDEWDSVTLDVLIPAGADSLTIEPFSRDDKVVGDPHTGGLVASFAWTAAALTVPVPPAALGNCVWQDLNNDGIQAGNGEGCVLGNDSEPPVPGVKVNLLVGNNCAADPDDRMATTDANGFYLFDNLEPGTYCVEFEKPSNLCEMGEPVFTAQNQGNDALDSDADPATGKSAAVILAAGDTNLSVDAGLFCPRIVIEKFTNGYDADAADGLPTPTPPTGGFVVGGKQVPLVAIGADITWTYKVTNTSTATLSNVDVTDSQGVTVSCPKTSLAAGESMDCTAMGIGLDLANTAGTVDGCGAMGQGTPVPTYENEGRVEASTPGGIAVSDVDLSHYCNPPDVTVEKFTNGHDGDDANGIPDANAGSFNAGDPTVAEVAAGADITWTYRVTNSGTEALDNVVVTDSKGVSIDCPADTLAAGASFDCTASGFAQDLAQSGGDVNGCTGPQGQGDPRPTYENLAMVTGTGQTSGVDVSDIDLSHYCNPPPPPRAALGNCVWEDLNNDGIQAGAREACALGSNSEPPVPNVKVNLLVGNNCAADPDGRMRTTDANGFYLFDDLEPGTYCVEFEKPSDFCELGEPMFTAQNQGNNDALDSDADLVTGQTAPLTLIAGERNLSVDAGLFCPRIVIEKFTNGYDADAADGFPTPTPPPGDFEVGDTKVPLVAIGADITWTYTVTNTSTATLNDIVVSDSDDGVTVSCPMTSLEPNESMNCLAMGTGLDLANTDGTVLGCEPTGDGTPVPTYENEGKVEASTPGGIEVSDVDLSHYCNPPDVMVEKFTNGHDGDDANGIPTANEGSFSPGDPAVAEVAVGDEITWTYRVTNSGTEVLKNVVVTDSKGVSVNCPGGSLAPGASIDCTASGFAQDLAAAGDVQGCDGPDGQGDIRPTYENLAEVTGTGQTSGVEVSDDDPSHYCNPPPVLECGLTVQKGCELPPPPLPPSGKCSGRLQAFTMIWDGDSSIQITGMSSGTANASSVEVGQEVTFSGPFSNNDVVVNFTGGQSTFHTSCSDGDMDGDTATNDDQQQVSSLGRDCGKFEGNGKGSSGINEWLLEGFVDDENNTLDCTVDNGGQPPAASCEFTPREASCDTLGKPSSLTFQYSGGACPGDNDQGSKSGCSGSIDPDQPVTVTVDSGTLGSVNPGETFIVPATGSNTTVVLRNGGGTQTNDVHTSCSAPLAAGDSYGALTLIALDGIGTGTDVIYSYLVSNEGPATVTGITVDDDRLGQIGTIASLAPQSSETLTTTAFITQTTTNIATVDGAGAPGAECKADSNPVVVTALPPPPCDASVAFKQLRNDSIKWTLSNHSAQNKATMDALTLLFPSDFGAIKEVKLDGAVFKSGDSDTFPNGVPSGETIGPNDWTETDISKRRLDQGEGRTLEVKFTNNNNNARQGDFDLTVLFKEGCMVSF